MIVKLQKRGDVSETRIEDLERVLQKRVGSSITKQVQDRIATLEKMLEDNLHKEVQKKSSAWVMPFILLAVVLALVFMYAYVCVLLIWIIFRSSISIFRRLICYNCGFVNVFCNKEITHVINHHNLHRKSNHPILNLY